jgi:hypothetical protein
MSIKSPEKKKTAAIRPARARYIKLGTGGEWEAECIEKGIIRFGFGSDAKNPERFSLCRAGKWDQLTQSFIAGGRTRGTATRFTNETRHFFEDDGSTLWITFVGQRLYWGLLAADPPKRHPDGAGVWRTVAEGWRWHDVKGEQLTKDRLSGALTKVTSYQRTSCNVDVAD